MYQNGIIHEIVWDDTLGKAYHLELHCVPCTVESKDSSTAKDADPAKTCLWMTKDHLKRVFCLLSPAITKHVLYKADSDTVEQIKTPSNVEMLEDEKIRIACTFKPDPWTTNSMKIVTQKKDNNLNVSVDKDDSFSLMDDYETEGNGQYTSHRLYSDKIVASVALNNSVSSSLEKAAISKSLGFVLEKFF